MEIKNKNIKPDIIRFLDDMRNVLADEKWARTAPNFELYCVYRGLKEKNGLRYDLTLIPPRMLGKEFVKTKGHYNIGNYEELYKVLAGEGIFLMQKQNKGKIEDVYCVKAKKDEYILIPPFYGHTAVNPSLKVLKLANWISKKCGWNYKSIEKKKGMCYYYTTSGWLKNKNYKKISKLRVGKPLKKIPKNLNFLYGKNSQSNHTGGWLGNEISAPDKSDAKRNAADY